MMAFHLCHVTLDDLLTLLLLLKSETVLLPKTTQVSHQESVFTASIHLTQNHSTAVLEQLCYRSRAILEL